MSLFAIKSKLFNLLVKLYAEQVVKEAYLGILGREADTEGLSAYSISLKKSLDLKELLADLVISDEHWQRALSSHSSVLVNATFQGLLGREPDAEALANYTEKLAESRDLSALLNEVSVSDEHWQRALSSHSSALVSATFQGLLGREPDAEALANYTEKLAESRDLSALLNEVSSSDEHKARYFKFKNHSANLIEAIYQGLLSRPADESGMKFYEKKINNPADITNIISTIKDSDEFTSKLSKKVEQKTCHNDSGWAQRVNDIDALYHRYKGSAVSSKELARHIKNEDPIGVIHRNFLADFASGSKKPRILIFGAYGNGNLGDVYQALALRDHLKSTWALQDTDIFACSLLKSSDYPFTENQKLPSNTILDSELVNSFDVLVIGGGGLLAHPHEPLPDENWVRKINIPIILLGVGASSGLLSQHRALLDRAVYVSARDAESIAAISTLRNDVVYAPDPILTSLSLDTMVEFDPPPLKLVEKIDVLWILKHPSNDRDKKILASILAKIKDDKGKTHTIVAIEPKLDKVLDDYFQDIPVIYVDTLSELLNYIKNANVVFSMRYHGAIFSLLMKRRTFGSSQSKIKELFSEIDGHNAYIEHSDDISKVFTTGGITPDVNHIPKMQLQFKHTLMAFRLPI